MHWKTICVCSAAILLGTGFTLHGQADRPDDLRKMAILDPAEAGPEFADQGEYVGQVYMRNGNAWASRQAGLQVAAHGDGQFVASLYLGGLPGAGGTRFDRLSLEGVRTESAVELQGDGTYVTLAGGTAKVASSSRQIVGELRKTWRSSPTLGRRAPSDAVVLFDGTSTSRLTEGQMTPGGLLMEGAEFDTPRDFTMHLEYRLPFMPHARGQGRANSGVYLQSRYEVQILDSFALEGVENDGGALYRQRRPAVNASYPPLAWQTYDIDFTSPRFDGSGAKVRNARLTVRHNGTLIHDNVEIPTKTGAGSPEGARLLPTKLQDHGNPVRFRNVWLVDRERATQFVQTGAPPMVWSAPGASSGARAWSAPRVSSAVSAWSAPGVWPARGAWSAGGARSGASGEITSGTLPGVTYPAAAAAIPSLPPYYWPEPQSYPWWAGRPTAPFHPELYAPHYRGFGPQYGVPVYGAGAW